MEDLGGEGFNERNQYENAKASKFQFKSKSRKHSKRKHALDDENESSSQYPSENRPSDREPKARRRHKDSKRRHRHHDSGSHRTSTRDGEYYDPDHRYRESIYDGLDDGAQEPESMDPEAAFRESLFDAMADDEGAAYWEGVYGQPIHVYSNTKPGPDGKLERMNDEEYADYVRTKMWEKSHQHIVEEREAREKARQRRKQHQRDQEDKYVKEDAEREEDRRRMKESLRRGEERRQAKEAEASWVRYSNKWDELKTRPPSQRAQGATQDFLPWPVISGKASQINRQAIEQFLMCSRVWQENALAVLKAERIRWHPDKIQQRFGDFIDSGTMKLVTAIFQVIDQLWTEHSGRRK